ncbi:hypothetical protein RSOLAG22IIIB_07043 [Rhizoctonia solani]|uniref:Gfd2/YDR514C-like C-terminal domain-containing protein n=1 Tax=Rhizoctonia solani TaxID=456999 RepID=A0A0K6GIE9_9AGAM|nr:hypothetical protein RSOLAG22IIIB_07043 [Rhizoctonia solani]
MISLFVVNLTRDRIDVQGSDWDLHSVYSAYIGHFQSHGGPCYDRSWGRLFSSIDDFLTFGWPTVTITDSRTGKGHIVTRAGSVGAFSKMVKTRFGETLPKISNLMQVIPYEHTQRHLRQITDMATYKKVYATIPAAEFSACKSRMKHGDLHLIDKLWHSRDKSWLSIRFVWSEKSLLPLEWGYAAVRCAPINAAGSWPPKEENFRKGHFVVAEYADKVRNKLRPTHPWEYAFGDTHVVGKSKLPDIINSVISSLATPDSESIANSLVLVGHNISGDLERLAELKIKLPHNMLIVDTAVASLRHAVFGPQLPPAAPLARFLAAQARAPRCTLGNAGNDAWLALGVMTAMVDRTSIPLNTATIGNVLPSPIPYPPKSASPSGIPPLAPVRPRYNSQMRPSPISTSPLPLPGTPPIDGFPFPSSSSSANPNARPISAVLARPRTGSAGAEAMSRLSLNVNLGSGPSLGFDPGMGRTARPASAIFGTWTSPSPRNSLNLVDEFGTTTGGGQPPISRSWNGKSVLGSGRPQTPLGLLDLKPGKSSKLVVGPSVRPVGGDESTEDESEANESEDEEPRVIRSVVA